MNWFNALVFGGIALLLIPALLAGGWIIGLVLAGLWLLLTVGGKEGWDLAKRRQSGATGAKHRARSLTRSDKDDGQRWNRD